MRRLVLLASLALLTVGARAASADPVPHGNVMSLSLNIVS